MFGNTIIILSTEDGFEFTPIGYRTSDDRLKAIELVLLFVFAFICIIICKTQKVSKQVTDLFLCPSVPPLIRWYVEIPSIEEFAYGVLIYRIIHFY